MEINCGGSVSEFIGEQLEDLRIIANNKKVSKKGCGNENKPKINK